MYYTERLIRIFNVVDEAGTTHNVNEWQEYNDASSFSEGVAKIPGRIYFITDDGHDVITTGEKKYFIEGVGLNASEV